VRIRLGILRRVWLGRMYGMIDLIDIHGDDVCGCFLCGYVLFGDYGVFLCCGVDGGCGHNVGTMLDICSGN